MKNNNMDEQPKKNQDTRQKSGNSKFPQEYEEQRNDNLRMKPQPLVKSEKAVVENSENNADVKKTTSNQREKKPRTMLDQVVGSMEDMKTNQDFNNEHPDHDENGLLNDSLAKKH